MRAGTSWLRKQLDRHPALWTATPKELHFFDRHFEDSPSAYAAHFAAAPPGALAGEITPAYAVLPGERIATVRRWIPEAKLLFMMRDPVARFWSHARKDFPQFRGKPVDDATVGELADFAQLPDVARRGDYLACLRAWLEHFPAGQIHCAFLEEAAGDPVAVLRAVFEFLGVDPEPGIDRQLAGRRENARAPVPMPGSLREQLEDELYRDMGPLAELLGRELPWGRG